MVLGKLTQLTEEPALLPFATLVSIRVPSTTWATLVLTRVPNLSIVTPSPLDQSGINEWIYHHGIITWDYYNTLLCHAVMEVMD